ncbi:MAG: hypothetical protein ACR5LA_10530 [Wolbachia sp.]
MLRHWDPAFLTNKNLSQVALSHTPVIPVLDTGIQPFLPTKP